jgi:hypothetical protein
MNPTTLTTPPHSLRPLASERQPRRETVGEIGALVDVVPFDGPPLIFLLVPWLFLGLMLAGPFAVLVTFAVLLVVTTALLGLAGAILAAPFVLVRHLRRDRPGQAPAGAPAAPPVRFESVRATA